jgi:hypothetical protein
MHLSARNALYAFLSINAPHSAMNGGAIIKRLSSSNGMTRRFWYIKIRADFTSADFHGLPNDYLPMEFLSKP